MEGASSSSVGTALTNRLDTETSTRAISGSISLLYENAPPESSNISGPIDSRVELVSGVGRPRYSDVSSIPSRSCTLPISTPSGPYQSEQPAAPPRSQIGGVPQPSFSAFKDAVLRLMGTPDSEALHSEDPVASRQSSEHGGHSDDSATVPPNTPVQTPTEKTLTEFNDKIGGGGLHDCLPRYMSDQVHESGTIDSRSETSVSAPSLPRSVFSISLSRASLYTEATLQVSGTGAVPEHSTPIRPLSPFSSKFSGDCQPKRSFLLDPPAADRSAVRRSSMSSAGNLRTSFSGKVGPSPLRPSNSKEGLSRADEEVAAEPEASVAQLSMGSMDSTRAGMDVQVNIDEVEEPWLPYESAPTENLVCSCLPRHFYQLRWAFMRRNPFCWHFPGASCRYTLGEITALLCLILQALTAPEAVLLFKSDSLRLGTRATGNISGILLMLVYFMAMHNNSVLLLLLGIPCDRSMPWHTLISISVLWNAVFHVVAMNLAINNGEVERHNHDSDPIHFPHPLLYMESTGWLLLGCVAMMIAMSLPLVRRCAYNVFYHVHILLAAVVAMASLLHGYAGGITKGNVPWSIPGLFVWLVDLLLRCAYSNCLAGSGAHMRYIPALLGAPGAVVQLSLPNTHRRFAAGQWVFLCIPRLGLLHWKRLSISSASRDSDVSVCFRCEGDWGRGAVAIALSTSVASKVYIEGPYGAPQIDVYGDKHTCFLIVSEGMGWPFLRAWKRQLVQDACRGRAIKVLRSVAILAQHDRNLVDEFADWGHEELDHCWPQPTVALEEVFLTGSSTRAAGRPTSGIPLSTTSAGPVSESRSRAASQSCTSSFRTSRSMEATINGDSTLSTLTGDHVSVGPPRSAGSRVAHMQLSQQKSDVEVVLEQGARWGETGFEDRGIRPDRIVREGDVDLSNVLAVMEREVMLVSEARVALLVCGSKAFLRGMTQAAAKREGSGVHYDIHLEEMK